MRNFTLHRYDVKALRLSCAKRHGSARSQCEFPYLLDRRMSQHIRDVPCCVPQVLVFMLGVTVARYSEPYGLQHQRHGLDVLVTYLSYQRVTMNGLT